MGKKIIILNGSPRKNGNTSALTAQFRKGAEEAGHTVTEFHLGSMKIGGCLGCWHGGKEGECPCVQKDDMEKVMPAYLESDMLVYATPIYYFDMTAQLAAAMQRVYCIGKPAKATKAAMLISSGSPGTGEGAIASYKNMLAYIGLEDVGVCALSGEENQSEEKLAEIRAFAKSL